MTDPNQPISYPVIVRFKKNGLMRFIGHLDWQALEQTIFLKAGLKLVVSEGPSHRLKFKTSPPTPVGVVSNTELAYLQLAEAVYPDEVKRRLASVCPDGIDMISVSNAALLPGKNPFGVIEACRYELDPGDDISEAVLDGIYCLLDEIKSAEFPVEADPVKVKPFWGRILELERNANKINLLVNQLEGVTFHAAKCASFLETSLGLAHYPLFTKLDYYRLKPNKKRLFASPP
ncbi:MAG: TIGR03936 family radical SAM-associated protein [bacterium]|nr:TIGR03936 family radical SAM-associated protein [bacterium]